MPIFKYQRVTTPGPNGTTRYFRNSDTEPRALELTTIDDWYYVFVPADAVLPEQPVEIDWQEVTLTDELKDRIKAASRPCHLIADRMQQMIRGAYSLEDEQYFARIGVGVALGAYTFRPGEMEALMAFGAHVESVRQWGRDERAKIGL
jgi:hypothetical protein